VLENSWSSGSQPATCTSGLYYWQWKTTALPRENLATNYRTQLQK